MKAFRLTAVAFLLTMCQASFAQYDGDGYYHYEYDSQRPSSRYSSYHSTTYIDDYEAGWCNFYGEYSPLKNYTTAPGADDRTFHTATIGFSYNYVIDNTPITTEIGFEASGSWFSERYNDGSKTNLNFYSGKIPLNLGVRFPVAEGFWIVPYGGINVKWNVYGEERETDAHGNQRTWKIFSGSAPVRRFSSCGFCSYLKNLEAKIFRAFRVQVTKKIAACKSVDAAGGDFFSDMAAFPFLESSIC